MDSNRTVSIAEKIKAIAISFIGAGILSQGTIYFKAQTNYNIPRVLYPVFELLGNKGLAVAMLILGLLLILWAYTKWKNEGSKPGVFALITVLSFGIFFSILFFTGKKATTEDLMRSSEERRAEGIEKMKAMEEPDFNNAEIKQHFANFNSLLKQREEATKNEDEVVQKKVDDDFNVWNEKSAVLIQKLETPVQKQQFALYLGKLSMQWQAVQ